MKKNNVWNIRHLVNESFDPSTQRIILKIVGFWDRCKTYRLHVQIELNMLSMKMRGEEIFYVLHESRSSSLVFLLISNLTKGFVFLV